MECNYEQEQAVANSTATVELSYIKASELGTNTLPSLIIKKLTVPNLLINCILLRGMKAITVTNARCTLCGAKL
jgi:hypothetical protein